jgi:hypothetical protein
MDEAERNKQTIHIQAADVQGALALYAHLERIIKTAIRKTAEGRVLLKPTGMHPADLLLAAASFRVLLFDTDGEPILLKFLEKHQISIQLSALETNAGMIFMPLLSFEGNITDGLAEIVLDPEQLPVGQSRQLLFAYDEAGIAEGFEQHSRLWHPSVDGNGVNFPPGIAGMVKQGSSGKALVQLVDITHRRVSPELWGDVRMGFLKDRPIRRRNLLTYVANKLGGVHLDAKRFPPDPNDEKEFRALATMYDPDFKAIMHGGLVATGMACLEFALEPDIHELLRAVRKFLAERPDKILKKN